MDISFHFIRFNIFIWRLVVCFLKWTCLCFCQNFSVWYLGQSSQVTIVCFIVIIIFLIHYWALHSFERLMAVMLSFVLDLGCWSVFPNVTFPPSSFIILQMAWLTVYASFCSLASLSKQYTTVSSLSLYMKCQIGTE